MKFIFTSDIHLQEDAPICRTDDYFNAQCKKLEWLKGIKEEHEAVILDAGDIFSKCYPSHWLVSKAIQMLPKGMITVPGNHDLPRHSLDLIDKSGLWVLNEAKILDVLLDKPLIY